MLLRNKVKAKINNCILSSIPSAYGGHADKLGRFAKEIVIGAKKERKYGVNGVLQLHLDLAKHIMLCIPNRIKLHYLHIHILEGANTGWHRDACRFFLLQAFII